MNIVFVQTADTQRYAQMLMSTSRTVKRYTESHGYAQEVFLGYKRGFWPWHATFNRIYILQELMERGWADWAVYMDADAYVADFEFDLDAYLADKAAMMAVMAPSGATQHWWDLNAGVFMMNLRHPETPGFVAKWRESFERLLPIETLKVRVKWGNPNDQELMHEILIAEPHLRDVVHVAPNSLMNSLEASFIRQVIREAAPDIVDRTRVLVEQVDRVMRGENPDATMDEVLRHEEMIAAVVTEAYEAILRRPPDDSGMAHYGRLVKMIGPEAASKKIVAELRGSEEYKSLPPVQVQA